MATDKVAELTRILQPTGPAAFVVHMWDTHNKNRRPQISKWKEIQEYITATDTTTTSNSNLPWTHKTHMPKIAQIRDNLHSNYISSLFPNDKWLTWVGYTPSDSVRKKAKTITSYMENKTRMGGFRNAISRMLLDYIDYGNVFARPSFETRYKKTGTEQTVAFIGPIANRIDPQDIVFNPLAAQIENTWKIVKSMETIGSLKKLAMTEPAYAFLEPFLNKREDIRKTYGGLTSEDWAKASQLQADGFGSLQDYYQSNAVEILEFYGDYHDIETGVLHPNQIIMVFDRREVVLMDSISTYGGRANIRHCGWRLRPNNLWAMSPLENLIGMQYMLNHLLNMGSNALDLKVMPPIKVIGEVEEFEWKPLEQMHISEGGDVQETAVNFNGIFTVKDWIEYLEEKMELYAGAPREAMGVRTPGEKTAFEVQSLENAAGRIFQEKITQFEIFMENLLNDMLELAHQNLDVVDLIRVVDDDIGVADFQQITKEDITASGVLRPIGARHFAQKAQELQNLVGISNSQIWPMIQPHISGLAMAKFVEDVVNLHGYNMFGQNIAVQEQQELQAVMAQAQEDNAMNSQLSEEEIMASSPAAIQPEVPA